MEPFSAAACGELDLDDSFDFEACDEWEPDEDDLREYAEAGRERIYELAADRLRAASPSSPQCVTDVAVEMLAESHCDGGEPDFDEDGSYMGGLHDDFRLDPRQALAAAWRYVRAMVAPLRVYRRVGIRTRRARVTRTAGRRLQLRRAPSDPSRPRRHSLAAPALLVGRAS